MFYLTDSYKFSHYLQYHKNTKKIHCYLSARGSDEGFKKVFFTGLKEHLYGLNTYQNGLIDWQKLVEQHGLPYNKEGFDGLNLQNKKGHIHLPINIYAVKENELHDISQPLLVVENTDNDYFWLPSFLETYLLKLWYPTTIATRCYYIKQMITSFYQKAGEDVAGVDFAYHNFGDRGSSSVESAKIGGMAHLTQFKGTDNFNAVLHAKTGFSVPASEHSTITSWGREREFMAMENLLETFKYYPIVACVSDSYDIYKATDFQTSGSMKDRIESNSYPIWVIRPDSGNPIEVITKMLEIFDKNKVQFTTNDKGYKLFKKYRILWGDGITAKQIENILQHFTDKMFSPANFVFGSGGDLMQNCSRDTLKFAYKTSAICLNVDGKEIWQDVYKDPITDSGKKSIKGRIDTSKMDLVYSAKDGILI